MNISTLPAPRSPLTPMPFIAQDDHSETTTQALLAQAWQAVRRWKWVIAAIIAACVVAGLIATVVMPRVYVATAQIEISRERQNITSIDGLETQDNGRDMEFYATQYTLLRARSLAARVAEELALADSPAFFAAHGEDRPAALSGADAERVVADLLLDHVTIDPVSSSRLVDISYASYDPEISARIVNAWVSQFVAETMDRQFASSAEARKFLQDQLDRLRVRLEESERSAAAYAADSDIIALDSGAPGEGQGTGRTLASNDLEALNVALNDARAQRVAAQSRLTGGGAATTPEMLDNPVVANLQARRVDLAGRYEDMMATFEPDYPPAAALRRQIVAVDQAIGAETARVSGVRQRAYREALAREGQLAARVAGLKSELIRQRQDAIQYNIFTREADTNRQLYDALLQRYKEIGVAGTVGASNIVMVDAAQAPALPSSPNLLLNIVLGLLAGAGFAAFATWLLEQRDYGVRNPEEVADAVGLPLLGLVPRSDDDPVEEIVDPKSTISEAIASLRSALAISTDHGLPRVVAVTSTQVNEGKSVTSLALAEVIARGGNTVVLVDADMRSPSQHKMLGTDNARGITDFLSGDDWLDDMLHETRNSRLSLLPVSAIPPNPAELLGSERMALLVNQLSARFDHVVIDAPPVLGLADAPMIGRIAEGTIFVIEAGRTSRRAMRTAIGRLQANANRLFGVVLSKADGRLSASDYCYSYEYAPDPEPPLRKRFALGA